MKNLANYGESNGSYGKYKKTMKYKKMDLQNNDNNSFHLLKHCAKCFTWINTFKMTTRDRREIREIKSLPDGLTAKKWQKTVQCQVLWSTSHALTHYVLDTLGSQGW